MEDQHIIQVEDKVPFNLLVSLSIQHMFTMFGTSILVPFIFDIDPAVVLFMNGMGTLPFIGVIKGEAPAYLESSFIFLAPAGVIISNFGYEYTLGGFVAAGFCGRILVFIVYRFRTKWIEVVLPPAAMGSVVALIGLELSGSAVSNAGLLDEVLNPRKTIVFVLTLEAAVFGSILFRKLFSVIPILIAATVGYASALAAGIVDFAGVTAAPIFALPSFGTPKFDLEAIMIIPPVLLVITSEHVRHQVITSKIVGRDLLRDPGLHRSLFGDNFSTMISGLIGSVPTTTCGENISVVTITRVHNVHAIVGAAVLPIVCSFIDRFSTLISTMPGPVIGGTSFLPCSMIGISGLRILVDSGVDYGDSRNLALTLVIFVTGLSGIAVKSGSMQLTGMVLSRVVGMILGLIFCALDYFKLINDQ